MEETELYKKVRFVCTNILVKPIGYSPLINFHSDWNTNFAKQRTHGGTWRCSSWEICAQKVKCLQHTAIISVSFSLTLSEKFHNQIDNACHHVLRWSCNPPPSDFSRTVLKPVITMQMNTGNRIWCFGRAILFCQLRELSIIFFIPIVNKLPIFITLPTTSNFNTFNFISFILV